MPFFLRDFAFIPGLAHHKPIVQRIDLPFLVIGEIHILHNLFPIFRLFPGYAQTAGNLLQPGRISLPDFLKRPKGIFHIFPGHQICIKIIVHNGIVFVRPCYRANAIASAPGRNKAAHVRPYPCRLHQHFRGPFLQITIVARYIHIKLKRIGNIRIDMILRRSKRKIGGGLLSVHRPPGIQGSLFMTQHSCPLPRFLQSIIAEIQQRSCKIRLRINKHRQYIHLRIPEIMALIALAGQSFRPHSRPAVPARCLHHMK